MRAYTLQQNNTQAQYTVKNSIDRMSNRRADEYQNVRYTIKFQISITILCETITNQIDYSNKNDSNVDELHVRDIDKDETKNVYNNLEIDVDTRDERMIYVDDCQKTQKKCH